jgi:hypothetical protein
MSQGIGACGAFGLVLSEHRNLLGETYKNFLLELEDNPNDEDGLFLDGEICCKYTDAFIEIFYVNGIVIPWSAAIYYTGTEEERPAQTYTPADDFVLGFGMYHLPWQYPSMDESFMLTSKWHTWVCME